MNMNVVVHAAKTSETGSANKTLKHLPLSFTIEAIEEDKPTAIELLPMINGKM